MKKITTALCFHLFLIVGLDAQSDVENHVLESKHLGEERAISVSLPSEYNLSDARYSVLYVLDGEYIFSYAQGTVDFLTNDFGYIPELIVVSIPNTNRNRDMQVSLIGEEGPNNFIKFLTLELFPFINKEYRVNGFDMLYGWSSASGIGIYLMNTQPQFLDGYILTGTGIGPKTANHIRENINNLNYQNIYFYACVEDEEPRRSALIRYGDLLDSLNIAGLNTKFEVIESSHVEMMSKGLYEGLNFIFSGFYMPDFVIITGAQAILEYYDQINKNYDFEVTIPVGAINESAAILMYQDKLDDAVQLLEHGITIYPYAASLYGTLAEVYELQSEDTLAIKYYQVAIDKSAGNVEKQLKYKSLLEAVKE